MIQLAQLNVIQFVKDQNVKFNVKKLPVLVVKFIAINQNAMFVVLRKCAKLKIVLNVKLFALLLTAVLPVLLQNQFVLQCAKKPNVIGNVKNQPLVLVLNVNYNVINQLVKLKLQLNINVVMAVAVVMMLTLKHQLQLLVLLVSLKLKVMYYHHLWKFITPLNSMKRTELKAVVNALKLISI